MGRRPAVPRVAAALATLIDLPIQAELALWNWHQWYAGCAKTPGRWRTRPADDGDDWEWAMEANPATSNQALTPDDLDQEQAIELPDREALSIAYPDPAVTMVPQVEQAAPGTPPGEPIYTIMPVEEEPM
jgi:hypothetical protein